MTQSDTERPHFFIHSPLIVGSDITIIRNRRKVIQGRSGAVPRQFHAETVLALEYIQYIHIYSYINGRYGLVGCQKLLYESCVIKQCFHLDI